MRILNPFLRSISAQIRPHSQPSTQQRQSKCRAHNSSTSPIYTNSTTRPELAFSSAGSLPQAQAWSTSISCSCHQLPITSFLHIDGCYRFVVGLIKTIMEAVINLLFGVIFLLAFIKHEVSEVITSLVNKLKQII